MSALKSMALNARVDVLRRKLKGTAAERYLGDDSKGVASSVLSMLSTNAKPIGYLYDDADNGKFSLKEHFQNIKQGSGAWLFLATKPSSRQLTQGLIACLTELSLCQLLDIGIKEDRRLWFIIDELSSLGKLPALPTLMSEGRKYGSCIICGLQSLNQLYSLYGQYEGSSIFGQFGTSFFFRNTESLVAKQISDLSGMETITRQQKNTSFGANEFRDGISYNEHQQKKPLIEVSDLSSLATGSCYVFLPEPDVRMAKIKVPYNNIANKHDGFSPKGESPKSEDNNSDTDNNSSDNGDKSKTTSEGTTNTESTNHKEKPSKKKKQLGKGGEREDKISNKNTDTRKDKDPHDEHRPKRKLIQKKQNTKAKSDNKLINNI